MIRFLVLFLSFFTQLSESSWAGGGGSGAHGGSGVQCEYKDKSVLSLTDTFDQEHILPGDSSEKLILDRVSELTMNTPYFRMLVLNGVSAAKKSMEFTDRELELVKDVFPVIKDKKDRKCRLVQVAIWNDRKDFDSKPKLEVNRKLWKMLSTRDKTALLLHEAVFAFERTFHQLDGPVFDSTNSREMVAMLLSYPFVYDVEKYIDRLSQLTYKFTNQNVALFRKEKNSFKVYLRHTRGTGFIQVEENQEWVCDGRLMSIDRGYYPLTVIFPEGVFFIPRLNFSFYPGPSDQMVQSNCGRFSYSK